MSNSSQYNPREEVHGWITMCLFHLLF